MKTQITILTLTATAVCSPIFLAHRTQVDTAVRLQSRQTGIIAKEYTQGGCRDVIFIFARGSTEIGNMVSPRRASESHVQISLGRIRDVNEGENAHTHQMTDVKLARAQP